MNLRLSELPSDSLQITSETRRVRRDGKEPEVDRTYLTISGTPEAFEWLSGILKMMAKSAGKEDGGSAHGVVVAPEDLPQLTVSEWDALALECRRT